MTSKNVYGEVAERTYEPSHSFVRKNGQLYIAFNENWPDGSVSLVFCLFELVQL